MRKILTCLITLLGLAGIGSFANAAAPAASKEGFALIDFKLREGRVITTVSVFKKEKRDGDIELVHTVPLNRFELVSLADLKDLYTHRIEGILFEGPKDNWKIQEILTSREDRRTSFDISRKLKRFPLIKPRGESLAITALGALKRAQEGGVHYKMLIYPELLEEAVKRKDWSVFMHLLRDYAVGSGLELPPLTPLPHAAHEVNDPYRNVPRGGGGGGGGGGSRA